MKRHLDREVAKLHQDLALAFGIAFLIAVALERVARSQHHETPVRYCDRRTAAGEGGPSGPHSDRITG